VAVAEHPAGPWRRFDQPLLDVTPGAWDCKVTTNPTCTQLPDGRFLLVYKAVGDVHSAPFYGPVVHGAAFADSPLGPFKKHPEPIFSVAGSKFPGEDPFIWTQGNTIYAFVKDNACHYSPHSKSIVLFESSDGVDWRQCPGAFITRQFTRTDGTSVDYDRVERPQLLFEHGRPSVLYCGVKPEADKYESFNVHVPIEMLHQVSCEVNKTGGGAASEPLPGGTSLLLNGDNITSPDPTFRH
jgi:hypothetical protein